MVGDKGRGRVLPIRRVRDVFLTLWDLVLRLSEEAKTILKLLGAGNSACDVAEAVACIKITVNYWKNKFVGAGTLRLAVKASIRFSSNLAPSDTPFCSPDQLRAKYSLHARVGPEEYSYKMLIKNGNTGSLYFLSVDATLARVFTPRTTVISVPCSTP